MSPNGIWSGSLERYHPYLYLQKVLKNPKKICTHSSLSKNAKSRYGSLGLLGVKIARGFHAVKLVHLQNIGG